MSKIISEKISRRRAGAGALVFGVILTAAGCGGEARPQPGAVPAEVAPVTAPTTADPGATEFPGGPGGPGGSGGGESAAPSGGTATPGGGTGVEGLLRAAKAALGAVPNSVLISIETEENGRLWEVQVVTADGVEHEMDVEADTGKVVGQPTAKAEDADDRAKHKLRARSAKIDYAQAAEKIEAQVPGGRITELNLDSHKGKTVWESDVVDSSGAKRSVTIDAVNGTVVPGG